MTFLRTIALLIALAAAFAAGAWAQKIGALAPSHTTYLQLTAPLRLSADGDPAGLGKLPAGTALYADAAFAEGHTRYIVYLNFKGKLPARQVTDERRNLIDPLWAEPAQPADTALR